MRAVIAQLQTHIVDGRRNVNNWIARDYGKLLFILATRAGDDYDVTGATGAPHMNMYRVNINDLNAYRGGNGALGGANGAPTLAAIQQQWADNRRTQIHIGTFEETLYGPFSRNTQDNTESELPAIPAANLPAYPAIGDQQYAAGVAAYEAVAAPRRTAKEGRRKPLRWRGVFNIGEQPAGAAIQNAALAAGTQYLMLPVRIEGDYTPAGYSSQLVKCTEPFFGYSSATTMMRCDYPLDTARLGKSFPPLIQDYKYDISRDWSKIRPSGIYQHDMYGTLSITPQTPQFATIREHDEFQQSDKRIMQIAEVTHDIMKYKTNFVNGEKPEIEIETRQGQFEYMFLYVDLLKRAEDFVMPTKNPIVGSLQFKVFGRENRFIRELDNRDLEHISRKNCNELSDWRSLHEAGRGVLIHLSDLGLTGSVPFGPKERVRMSVKLLSCVDPAVETDIDYQQTDTQINNCPRQLTVAMLRFNRVLRGAIDQIEFSYLNETK